MNADDIIGKEQMNKNAEDLANTETTDATSSGTVFSSNDAAVSNNIIPSGSPDDYADYDQQEYNASQHERGTTNQPSAMGQQPSRHRHDPVSYRYGISTSRQRTDASSTLLFDTGEAIKGVVHGSLAGTTLEGADTAAYKVSAAARTAAYWKKRIDNHRADKKTLEELQKAMPDEKLSKPHLVHASDLKLGLKDSAKSLAAGTIATATQGTSLEGIDEFTHNTILVGKGTAKGASSLVSTVRKKAHGKQATTAAARSAQKKRNLSKAIAKARKDKAAASALSKGNALHRTGAALNAGMKLVAKFIGAILSLILPIAAVAIGISCMFAFILLLFGGHEKQMSNASMEGMPKWVTYDMVLRCLEEHERGFTYTGRDNLNQRNITYTAHIPAGALLGQMMIENGTSDTGSTLGYKYHNYLGIKDFSSNPDVTFETTEYDDNGMPYKTMSGWRDFKTDDNFWKYRLSDSLYYASRYAGRADFRKACDTNDSALFIYSLAAGGYCTASPENYRALYESLCRRYPLLAALDHMTVAEFKARYGANGSATATGGQGQALADASDLGKRIVASCYETPTAGQSACAAWIKRVYEHAGYPSWEGNGNDLIDESPTSTDWDKIQVGQVLSASRNPNPSTARYGHCAIYIGDGQVMENLTVNNVGVVNTRSLSDWVAFYQRYGTVKYGWPPTVSVT